MPTATENRVYRDLTVRSYEIRADTWDDKTRSFEAVLATEAPVMVLDMQRWEPVEEILLMPGCKIPKKGQIPLLDSHDRTSIRSGQIGSVRNLRVEGDKLIGRCYLSAAEEEIATKVREGHVTDCSVGYQVRTSVIIEPEQTVEVEGHSFTAGARPLRITTEWLLKENSLCPIGADEGAKVREEPAGGLPAITKEGTMPQVTPASAGALVTPKAAPVPAPIVRAEPLKLEIAELAEETLKRRVLAVTPHDLVAFAERQILEGKLTTFETIRDAILAESVRLLGAPVGSTESAGTTPAAPAKPKVADIPGETLVRALVG